MSRRDIDIALTLIAQRLPHLRQPRRIDAQAFARHRSVLGQYRWFTDSIRLNLRYLDELDDAQALDLLDTLIHELLHRNSRPLRLLRDTFRPHPHIWHEARRLCETLRGEFLALRRDGTGDSGDVDRASICGRDHACAQRAIERAKT